MITKNVKLWLGSGPRVVIPVSQFDTMWQFLFTIIKDSVEWTIPGGASAVLNGRKPDGNVFAFSGTIADNKVTVNSDVQMTACAGETVCELSIAADGKVVGTANFSLMVEAAPKSPDDVSSESTLPAYEEMLELMSGDIEDAVDDWLNAHPQSGMTTGAKNALLALLAKVAYIDDDGQELYDALEDELFPPANLTSITAVFTQGSAVIYDTAELDDLRQYLVVTANYSDSSTETVTTYTLSGTLSVGTSTITVSYGGKTTTFTVTVTEAPPSYLTGYTEVGSPTISNNILTPADGKFIKTPQAFSPNGQSWKITCKFRNTTGTWGSYTDLFGSVDSSNASARSALLESVSNDGSKWAMYLSSNNIAWDIANSFASQASDVPHTTNSWLWVEMSFTGSAYVFKYSTDGETYTTGKTYSSSTSIMDGFAVGFGLKRNGVLQGDIDLSACEIWINDSLWWKAIA